MTWVVGIGVAAVVVAAVMQVAVAVVVELVAEVTAAKLEPEASTPDFAVQGEESPQEEHNWVFLIYQEGHLMEEGHEEEEANQVLTVERSFQEPFQEPFQATYPATYQEPWKCREREKVLGFEAVAVDEELMLLIGWELEVVISYLKVLELYLSFLCLRTVK